MRRGVQAHPAKSEGKPKTSTWHPLSCDSEFFLPTPFFVPRSQMHKPHQRFVFLLIIYLLSCSAPLLLGCSGLLLHYYDPTTYKNLTDLKPKVSALYDSFTEVNIDRKAIGGIRLELAQVYEYVKGKGESNQETTNQITIIRDMFERHVQDRLKNGKWSEIDLENMKENIEEAFDIAISTERLKNKNE